MKAVLIIAALIGLGYYILNYHSPFQTEVTDPYYSEIRVKLREHDVELVGIGKMNSFEDCQARSLIVWANTLEHLGEVSFNSQCTKTLPKRFLKLFENEQTSASYIAFDKGRGEERDGRFLFYGIPASHVYQACEKIIKEITQSYSGAVYCVQGHVG